MIITTELKAFLKSNIYLAICVFVIEFIALMILVITNYAPNKTVAAFGILFAQFFLPIVSFVRNLRFVMRNYNTALNTGRSRLSFVFILVILIPFLALFVLYGAVFSTVLASLATHNLFGTPYLGG